MKLLSRPAPRRARSGITLVIVLAFLVLLSTLIIAFISSVQTEAVSSANYGSGVAAKQLVESALHVAMGQVSDATKSTKTAGSTADADRLAWASQPGMIRTWGTDGQGWKIFKLYTAKNMVVDYTGGIYKTADNLATEVPDDWAGKPALYTDLNSPVLVADTTGLIDRNSVKYRAEYPIIDPLALGLKSDLTDRVEGFSLGVAPGYGGGTTNDPKGQQQPKVDAGTDPTAAKKDMTANPAPMPVVWFYVLKDGTFTVPSDTKNSGRTATWGGGQYAPTAANPIVGRVAFWGDDESCKLNLNTSSEPTPWDTPRALCKADLNYGNYQPVQKEFQRFPGHPYMTALSPVFFPNKILTTAEKESIYGLVPRVQIGGSTGATVKLTVANKIAPDSERLYATVDEFLFLPGRGENAVTPSEQLKRSRFFLTANSRAPEVSLFGGPRISLWPESSDLKKRTVFDKLAAFCTTIGSSSTNTGKAYYFQRNTPYSTTADYSGISRNKELYDYLKTLTAQKFPGFGGDFKTQWGDDHEQVLTEIFDYIRCVNLADPQLPDGQQYTYNSTAPGTSNNSRHQNGQVAPITIGNTKGFGRFHSISQFGFHFICSQQGSEGVLATKTPPEKLNEGERMVEAAFLFEPFSPSLGFYKLAEDMNYEVKFTGSWTIDGQDLKLPASTTKPMNNKIGQGYHNNGREHGGTGGIRGPVQGFGGKDYPFVSTPSNDKIAVASGRVIVGKAGATKMVFSGGTIEVKVYAGTGTTNLVHSFSVQFPGGSFPVPDLVQTGTDKYRGAGASDKERWWTFKGFDVKNAAGNVTKHFPGRYENATDVPHAPGLEYKDKERRWDQNDGAPGFKMGGLFRREDVVRTIVPKHGDMRLVAATNGSLGQAGASEFVKVRDSEWESDYRFLHIFSNVSGPHFHFGFCNEPTPDDLSPAAKDKDIPPAAKTDQLTASASVFYHYSRLPEIRPGAGKQYNKWGDFDNGVAQWMDGAYINKPDEGNISSSNIAQYYFSWNDSVDPTDIFFSPNRIVPSAGMLGSLPTGVKRNQPWQTLLFRPQTGHPGDPGYADPKIAKSPVNKAPDHLIMDLFWMPFVEPYAISEPFSTAGKINMNYEIAPFSYIRRATGMHGLLKSEEPLAIPNVASKIYKLWDHETNDNGIMPDNPRDQDGQVRADWAKASAGQAPFDKMRVGIDPNQTLSQFDKRFSAGEIFRSASQICETHLVRKGEQLSEYESGDFWTKKNILTGDNSRERPYTNLYSRLTTKSNVFTIHVRAQVLRKSSTGKADEWDEDRDKTVSEFRGSTIIERYIDAADPNLPDFASPANSTATLDASYRFRMVTTKRFAP